MKLSWLLALKVFIVLFWILGIAGFIIEAINSRKAFLEIISTHWIAFIAILLGCISIILDFVFKNKNIMVWYFLNFFCL